MDELLVGVDGSEESRTALRWAAGAGDVLGLPLRVLSAWEYPTDAALSVGRLELPTPDEADAAVEARLAELLAEAGITGDRPVVAQAVRGSAAEALLRAANDGVRMLVVGSRGLGGFRGLRLGSVSRQLVEHAPRPVTVVRADTDVSPVRLRTVLVAVDGSEDSARAMTFAARVAVDAGAELVVVNATGWRDTQQSPAGEVLIDLDTRRSWVEEWCTPLRDAGIPYRSEVVRGDPRSALPEFARDVSADLVVVGSRGRGPVTGLVLGSVATSLVERCEVPVTVLPHLDASAPFA